MLFVCMIASRPQRARARAAVNQNGFSQANDRGGVTANIASRRRETPVIILVCPQSEKMNRFFGPDR